MNKSTKKTAVGIGAGIIAASAAAGYYFYGSDNAKKRRKIAAKWAINMKNEVIKESRHLSKASPKAFAAIVDGVAKTYEGVRSIDTQEVRRAARELKSNWDKVQKETKRTVKKSVAHAKATVKRAKSHV